jgi:hypothetical protein
MLELHHVRPHVALGSFVDRVEDLAIVQQLIVLPSIMSVHPRLP